MLGQVELLEQPLPGGAAVRPAGEPGGVKVCLRDARTRWRCVLALDGRARVTQRLKPGVVFLPTHYGGSSPYQSRAYQFGLNMTDFVPFHMEPGTGATMSQEVAVTVRKVEA